MKAFTFYKGYHYWTTDGKHRNLFYIESYFSYFLRTWIHVFDTQENEKVELKESDFDVKYSIFIDL